MKNTYFDLIGQTYYFPHRGVDLRDGYPTFKDTSFSHTITFFLISKLLQLTELILIDIVHSRELKNRINDILVLNSVYDRCVVIKCKFNKSSIAYVKSLEIGLYMDKEKLFLN